MKIEFDDNYFMSKAIDEAKIALSKGEVPIGAVIVADNKIIARAHNMVEALNDVTAHAEILAITSASNYIGGKYLENCSIYVTLEPCNHYGKTPPCTKKIIKSGIKEVFYSMNDIDEKVKGKSFNILSKKNIKVRKGLLKKEANNLYDSYIKNTNVLIVFPELKSIDVKRKKK